MPALSVDQIIKRAHEACRTLGIAAVFDEGSSHATTWQNLALAQATWTVPGRTYVVAVKADAGSCSEEEQHKRFGTFSAPGAVICAAMCVHIKSCGQRSLLRLDGTPIAVRALGSQCVVTLSEFGSHPIVLSCRSPQEKDEKLLCAVTG